MSERPTWTQLDFPIAAEDEEAATETLTREGASRLGDLGRSAW